MDKKSGKSATKIKTAMPRDNSSMKLGGEKKMGGSVTNLAHSLSGSSAKQK